MNHDGIGGTNGMASGGLIIPPNSYDFTELQARQVLAQVKKVVGAQGGQMPIPDVTMILFVGVLLDKLNQIGDRLTVIEQAMSIPAYKQDAAV